MAGDTRTLTVKWVGDSSSIEKSSKKAGGALSKVGTIAAGAFTGTALLGGAEALVGFLGDATGAAMQDQQAQATLAKTLQNTAHATKGQIGQVEDYITKVGKATGVTDDEMRPAFANLARATGSVSKSQELMNTALDISAATGKPLETVTMALGKAYQGNTTSLAKLGIKVKGMVPDTAALARAQTAQRKALLAVNEATRKYGANSEQAKTAMARYREATGAVTAAQGKSKKGALTFTEVLKNLNKTYGGQAAAAANTSAGKMKRLQTQYSEMKESIGSKLLPVMAILMDFMLNQLPKAIGFLVKWVQKNWPKIQKYIAPLVTFFKRTVTNIKQIVKGIIQVFQGLIQFVRAIFSGQWGKAWDGILKIFKGFANIFKGYFKQMWNYLQNITMTALKWLLKLYTEAWKRILETALNFAKNLGKAFLTLMKNLPRWAWEGLQALLKMFVRVLTTLLTWYAGLWLRIGKVFLTLIRNLPGWAWTALQALMRTFVRVLTSLLTWYAGLWQRIGRVFLNLMRNLPSWAWNGLTALLRMFQRVLVSLFNWYVGLWRKVGNAFLGLMRNLPNWAWSGLTALWRQFGSLMGAIYRTFTGAISSMIRFFQGLPGRLVDILRGAAGWIVSTASNLGHSIGDAIYKGVTWAVGKIGGAIGDLFKGAMNWLIDLWNRVDLGLHLHLPSWLGGKGIDIDDIFPDIPRLAQGGIARTEGLAYLHPNELVVPLPARMGTGANYTINISVAPMTDPAAVGRATVEAIRAYERKNGVGWRN